MDVPAAAAGPWIALGAVLGVLLVLAAGATVLRRRPASRPEPGTPLPPAAPRDDLADFLAHPPGTRGVADGDGDGWASLAPPPPRVERDAPAPAPAGGGPAGMLAGLAVAALLLVGTAAALAVWQRSPEATAEDPAAAVPSANAPSSASAAPSAGDGDAVRARLAFGGVVLEEHAVGITAAYPELELTGDGEGRDVARLRLPTVNCLATAAPPEAGDPRCRAARTEYAELTGPDLRVERDGDRLAVSGRFATYLRSPGEPAEPTGRSYDVSVTVAAAGDERAGWRSAEGELRWDDQRTTTRTDGAPSVLHAGG